MRNIVRGFITLLMLVYGLAVWANPNLVYVNVAWTGPDNCGGHTWLTDAFATIQAGITTVAEGGTVAVAAGRYPERLVISKSVTLLGPQVGVNPNAPIETDPFATNPARTNPALEASIVPPTHEVTLPTGTLITVQADNITIDGFTLNGDNTLLDNGTAVRGADANAALGVGTLNGNLQGTLIAHNIIQNFVLGGVRFDCPSQPKQAKGMNAVLYNRIANISDDGLGVRANAQFLRVADNTIIDTGFGIQNHFVASTEGTQVPLVTGNRIRAAVAGIMMVLLNDMEGNTGPNAMVDHNIVHMTTSHREDFPATGLVIFYIEHQSRIVVTDNTLVGGDAGIQLWEVPTTTPTSVVIANTSITGARYGIWYRNYLPMPETGPARPSEVGVSGVTITNAQEAGLYLEDDPQGTSSALLRVTGTVAITGGPVGIRLQGTRVAIEGIPNCIGQTVRAIELLDGAQLTQIHN